MDQNFATKYRPLKFADVVGQSTVIQALKTIASADGIAVRSIFLKGSWGSGKCVSPDTIIKTDDGIRYAKDIIGNETFSINGKNNGFLAKEKNLEKRVLAITTKSGSVFKVTKNHPVLVWEDKQFKFKQAGDLNIGDTVIEDVDGIYYSKDQFDETAYMFGLLLGDGTLTSINSVSFETTDPQISDFVNYFLEKNNCSCSYDEPKRDKKYLKIMRWRFNSLSWLSLLCSEESMTNHTADTKELPKSFWKWPAYKQISLLQGLMDTDGSCDSGGSIELSLNSYNLIYPISQLMRSMGFSVLLRKRNKQYKRIDGTLSQSYRLTVRAYKDTEDYKNLFRLKRKFTCIKSTCHPEQSKQFKYKGFGEIIYQKIKDLKLSIPKKDRVKLNCNFHNGEFSYCAGLRWIKYFKEKGISLEGIPLYDNMLPVEIVNISEDEVEYTVDLQCLGDPIFSTDGVITHNTTLSRIFGKALNCKKFKETGDICGECDGCKEANSQSSQTYLEFDSSIVGNVDAIRSLSEKLAYYPSNGRRLVTLDECHSASKQALNALLKMVEDGVPNTMFLFASTEDILPTIKSRSLCLDITPIPLNLIVERLRFVSDSESVSISDEALETLATKSNGHMRDALSLLQLYSIIGDSALSTSYQFIVRFFKAALSKRMDIAEEALSNILLYPIVDVKSSIYRFIKNCYTSKPNDELYPFQQVVSKIFNYTFSQVSQFALNDEVGVELYFRAFLEKLK